MLKDLTMEIVHEENAKPMHDAKELLLFRIFERLAALLDENQPFVGDNEMGDENEDENG